MKVLLNQSCPWTLVNKPGFKARKFIIIKWFFLGGLLSWAYLSTLLATLVVIKYEKTVDTIDDMDKSGLPFLIPEATAPHRLVATDPRPAMRRIWGDVYMMSTNVLRLFDPKSPTSCLHIYSTLAIDVYPLLIYFCGAPPSSRYGHHIHIFPIQEEYHLSP